MLYQPITIHSAGGLVNKIYGVGVITKQGAYLTGKIPPFKRIGVTAYLPAKTIFRDSQGNSFIYRINPSNVLGNKIVKAQVSKPTPHVEDIQINLIKFAYIDGDIIITEEVPGSFKVSYITKGKVAYQPNNGWSTIT